MPDPVPLYVALAAVLANRMEEGDPLWLMIVGGSSRGKTEILVGMSALEYVRTMGSLSEAALLSGTPKKDQEKTAKGGILRELPATGGVLLVKDFGAILSMPRERRASVLQALREIYDGRYTRDVGTSGALKLEWAGRLGFIAGATGELDRAHAVISALGERWLTLRLGDDTAQSSARAALRHSATARMREELRSVVGGYLGAIEPPLLEPPNVQDEDMLAALAELAATARSPVLRDTYRDREIELVPQSEGPGRIVRQFHKLMTCLEAMGLGARDVREV
jgi:hypothetical protein